MKEELLLDEGHRYSNMSSKDKLQLCNMIVSSVAEAIMSPASNSQILDMFLQTSLFQQVLFQWRHPETNLSVLHLAIIYNRLPIVQHLCKKESKSMACKPLHDSDGTSINNHFLLACKVGALDIIQYMLSLEADDTDLTLLRTPGYLSLDGKTNDSVSPKLPLELCLEGKHLQCAIFLCNYILSHSVYKDAAEKTLVLNSSPLHQACHFGCAELVRLILERSTWGRYINAYDGSGFTPLHVTARNGDNECLRLLLQHGASVNIFAECHSVLHILYSNKQQPQEFVDCTKVLIQFGVDVNAPDHNENTPLDYLAYEFGQKYSRSAPSGFKAFCGKHSSKQTDVNPKSVNYRKILLNTMELLLDAGAHTHTIISHTPDGVLVDHTIIHTLLQNTGWPLSSCIMNSAHDVYVALELLFRYGSDPNVLAKHNLTSAFTTLILQSLHQVQETDMKCQFVHLFILHGVDLDCIVPPPRQFRKHPTDCIWSVRPVMLALEEKHPIDVIWLMFDYMGLNSINDILKNAKMRDWQMYILQLESNKTYRQEWLKVKKQLRKSVRSLKHICKLSILKSVSRKASNTESLPLPKSLKAYLLDIHC